MKGSRVLVSGGAGFVGSNLVKKLLTAEAESIHVVDNLLSAERTNLPDDNRIFFQEGSIADDGVLKSLSDNFDYVFHLATYHGNQSSIHDPIADHDNNTLTTLKLFERLKDFKRVKKIVYSGAGCAVAEKTFDQAAATVESDVVSLKMDSPYSMSKIFGEFYSVYYHDRHKLPVVRVRFQNVFGPGEILGAGKWRGTPATVWRNVTPTFIFRSLNGMPLTIENEGVATRDFIYVDDIVAGLIAAGLKGKPGDVYNLASGKEISIRELADKITLMTGSKTAPVFLPKRDWDNSGKRYGSPAKAKAEIGFEAKVPFDQGLRQTVEWTRDNLALIKKTMAKHDGHMKT